MGNVFHSSLCIDSTASSRSKHCWSPRSCRLGLRTMTHFSMIVKEGEHRWYSYWYNILYIAQISIDRLI